MICPIVRKALVFSLIPVTMITTFTIIDDYSIYQSNVSSPSCCGYVSPSWYERPITHSLVEWTEPRWTSNATQTENWLVSDGLVNGKVEFWTIWEREEH